MSLHFSFIHRKSTSKKFWKSIYSSDFHKFFINTTVSLEQRFWFFFKFTKFTFYLVVKSLLFMQQKNELKFILHLRFIHPFCKYYTSRQSKSLKKVKG